MMKVKKRLLSGLLMIVVIFLATNSIVAAQTIMVNTKPYTIFQPNGNIMRVVYLLNTSDSVVYCLQAGKDLPQSGEVLSKGSEPLQNGAAIKYIIENAATSITRKNTIQSDGVDLGVLSNDYWLDMYFDLYPENPNDGSDVYDGAKNVQEATTNKVDYESYIKTQLAIWYYTGGGKIQNSEGEDITTNVTNTYVGFQDLITKASNAKLVSGIDIALSGNTKMTLNSDYYISDLIQVTSTDASANITLSATASGINGIQIVNSNGTPVTTVKSGAQIRVKVPNASAPIGDTQITLTASGSNTSYIVYEYSSANSSTQTVARVESKSNSDKASMILSFTKQTEVSISKLDVTGEEELSGATLQILDENKKEISCTIVRNDNKEEQLKNCTWVSKNSSVIIKNLAVGKYYLVEKIAPDGYVLSEETVPFSVNADGTTTEVKMENKLNTVKISKLDATEKKELAGATLEIQDEEGNIVKYCTDSKGNKNTECKWVSTEKPYEIEGMPNGTYYLVETIAPKGYVLNKEKVLFEVDGSKAVVEVEMLNYLEPEVPDTLSSKSALFITVAMVCIGLGIGTLAYVKRHKTNKI